MDLQNMDTSEGHDSTSESSEDASLPDVEPSEEDLGRINELESEVEGNPYGYTAHTQLIDSLKAAGMRDRLKVARQRMSQVFPLTERMWQDWMVDEVNEMEPTEQARLDTYALFDRAVEDYLSVDLWVDYTMHSLGGLGDEGGEDLSRGLFEVAVKGPAGWHCAKGVLLWDTYRMFETSVLQLLQAKQAGSVQTPDQMAQVVKQSKRIGNLYGRQLARPLLSMEKTHAEWMEWREDVGEDVVEGEECSRIEEAYQQSLKELNIRAPYERALEDIKDDKEHLTACRKYLNFELKEGSHDQVVTMYERTLSRHCLYADIWSDYCLFLEKNPGSAGVVLPTYNRALRNCPWYSGLWVSYLRACEKRGLSHKDMLEEIQRALSAGFQASQAYLDIWCVYCDYMRRRVTHAAVTIGPAGDSDRGARDEPSQADAGDGLEVKVSEVRQTFEGATQYLLEHFGEDGDPDCIVPKYSALFEAQHCRNMERAREIWNEILLGSHKYRVQTWLDFAQFERAYGDHKHRQKVYMRALKVDSIDDPQLLCSEFVRFQREEGTLDQVYQAESRVKEILDKVKAQKKFTASHQTKGAAKGGRPTKGGGSPVKGKRGDHAEESKKGKSAKRPLSVQGDSKRDQAQSKEAMPPPSLPPPSKKSKPSTSPSQSTEVETQVKSPAGVKDEPQGDTPVSMAAGRQESPDRTVFVSNLDFSTTEAELREIFSECGAIADVRLIKNAGGKSKGYGYIEFEQAGQSLSSALTLDRKVVGSRPMYVSECRKAEVAKPATALKYSTTMEKNKLFVRGLDFSVGEKDLMPFFMKFGQVTQCRLVTYKNGHSKGLAYVEYANEAQAAAAVMKADGQTLKGKPMSVAISNPPPRRPGPPQQPEFKRALGGGKLETDRGKARTQLMMQPRAIRAQPSGKPASSQSSMRDNSASSTGSAASSEGPAQPRKPMSNSDFRNMLLKK